MNDSKAALLTRIAELDTLRSTLLAELVSFNIPVEDRLLTVQEAASVLSVSTDWLYRHADDFMFTVRPGAGQLRFSNTGLQEYLKRARR